MNKKITIIPIIVVIVILVINFSSSPTEEEDNNIFHVTLANPDLYIDGKYTNSFEINKGEYSFRFVPNGSSPEILSINLDGNNFQFSENFELEGTLHQTGISEYFTWNYQGEKMFSITEKQNISISINPNGNEMGSVSVDILQN